MSIVDSLRKLSLKLTGAYSTGEDIEDNVEYIAENYSGGGSGSDSTPIVRIQQDDTNAYILKSDIDALFGDSNEESAPCFCLVGLEGDPAYYFAINPGFYRAIRGIDSFGSNNLSILINVADFMEADVLYFTNKTVSTSGSGTPTTERYELDAVTKDRYILDL